MATQLDLRAPVSTTAPPAMPRQPQAPHTRLILDVLWRHPRAAFGLTIGISAVVASAIALTMPRFPATAGQAMLVMVLGLAVGFVGGITLRSRWAMMFAPLACVLFFAVGRLATNVHGPTIDGIDLDTTYGIVAFGLGCVVPGVLGLLATVVGASLGAALARRLTAASLRTRRLPARAWLYARRGISTLTAVGLVALGVGMAQPASTSAVRAADGRLNSDSRSARALGRPTWRTSACCLKTWRTAGPS